jgi:hypothetical protein
MCTPSVASLLPVAEGGEVVGAPLPQLVTPTPAENSSLLAPAPNYMTDPSTQSAKKLPWVHLEVSMS